MFKEYNKFDLANALYHWLQHNWTRQGDPLYSAFCTLTTEGMYKPGRSEESYEDATDGVLEIYNELTLDNYQEALDIVTSYESEE